MTRIRLKPEEEQRQIAKIMEAEKPKHHEYHYHTRTLIKILNFHRKVKGEMELQDLKAIMRREWASDPEEWSHGNKLVCWFAHFKISKALVKQRIKNNLKPYDVAEGHSYTPLRTLKDVNEYYAFVGAVLMALKEREIAIIIGYTEAKLNRTLEQQIPVYYTVCQPR